MGPSDGSCCVVELESVRARLDRLNLELLQLLNQRLRLVEAAVETKLTAGLGLHDAAREREMLAALQVANGGPLPPEELRTVFRAVFAASLRHAEGIAAARSAQ